MRELNAGWYQHSFQANRGTGLRVFEMIAAVVAEERLISFENDRSVTERQQTAKQQA